MTVARGKGGILQPGGRLVRESPPLRDFCGEMDIAGGKLMGMGMGTDDAFVAGVGPVP
jgi:hypothetical protein